MVDTELLTVATEAQARLIEADHQADLARAEFHRSVRRLHLNGASLREIADALGLSHQRVHQIVEGAGGGRRWRKPKRDGEARSCSFCGRPQRKARRLIAGPGVFICEHCVDVAEDVLETGAQGKTAIGVLTAVPHDQTRERCSFCGKRRGQATGIASTGDVSICAECLRLCNEIAAERLS